MLINDAFNKLQQVNVTTIDPDAAAQKKKTLTCFPFGLDFQRGQTFTEMTQTVQINHRSVGGGSLHSSGSEEDGSRPFENHFASGS